MESLYGGWIDRVRSAIRGLLMANDKGKNAFAFVKDYLTKKKGAPFAEVAEAAKAEGHKVYPIVYGRAQLLLGHVKAGKKAAKKTAVKRGPGRPPKSAAARAMPARRGPVVRRRPRVAISVAWTDSSRTCAAWSASGISFARPSRSCAVCSTTSECAAVLCGQDGPGRNDSQHETQSREEAGAR